MGKNNLIIFFDRDGVLSPSKEINGVPTPIFNNVKSLDYETKKIIISLKKKYKCFLYMITNQPDIARGLKSFNEILAENNSISEFYLLDDWQMCPHDTEDKCHCRKPKIGMIENLVRKYNLNTSKSYTFLIGDRRKDIEAAIKANIQPIFIDKGYNENKFYKPNCLKFTNTNNALKKIEEIIDEY